MYIMKETLNSFRSVLRRSISLNRKTIETLDGYIEFTETDINFRNNYAVNPMNAIAWINERANLSLPHNADIREIVGALEAKKAKKCALEKKLQSLLAGLSKDGFTKATYSLPFMPYICRDSEIAVSFMMVTGILKNAKEKHSNDDLMNDLERELFSYEVQMAQYIEDDFSIKRENMNDFLILYREYLELYKKTGEVVRDLDLSLNYVNRNVFLMGIYITFSNVDYYFEPSEVITLAFLYESYMSSGLVAETEAVCLACEMVFYEVEKALKRKLLKAHETPKENPLSLYAQDGVIIKSCNLDEFEKLLNSTKMTSSQKEAYLDAMRQYIENEQIEAHKNRVLQCRKSVLSSSDLELYNLARCYHETKKTTMNIDSGIELLMGDIDLESRELIIDDLAGYVDELRKFFAPIIRTEEPSESVVYYTCLVEDADGVDVKIPCILKSILADKNIKKYEVNRTLNEIIAGTGLGERKIKGTVSPYNLYVQGQDIRIFYTRIGDTLVVIDLAYGDEVYDRAKDVVSSQEFQDFMREVEDYIAAGHRPNAQNFTDIVKTSLNRTDKIIKLI